VSGTSAGVDPRRCVIGMSLLQIAPDRSTGTATYVRNLSRVLVQRARHDYVFFASAAKAPFWREHLPVEAARVVSCGPDPYRKTMRALHELFVLPQLAKGLGVDVLFFPYLVVPVWRRPPCVVTLYDLMFKWTDQTDFTWLKKQYIDWSTNRLRKRARHIFTVSQFCRRDIIARLGVRPDRVSVTPIGLDTAMDLRHSTGPPHVGDRYLLSVASAYPHKRLDLLVACFERIAVEHPSLRLKLAGTYGSTPMCLAALRDVVRASSVADRIDLVSRLPPAELAALYRDATVYVSASGFEGFGIPILEAMAAGCPVAASPAAAVMETLDGHGWIAADWSSEALGAAISEAMQARRDQPERLLHARARAIEFYRWERAAEEAERVFTIIGDADTAGQQR
jgi:glycosyltransferase involved in cell wall biosynthesis